MRRTRLKPIGNKRIDAPARAIALYCDSRGVPFGEHRYQEPMRGRIVSLWPKINRVVSPDVVATFREQQDKCCWACIKYEAWSMRYFAGLDVHHICSGSRGKSDELCLLTVLCRGCHEVVNTTALPLGRLLFLKWKFDRPNTDWVRTALALRRYLPDLITDEEWEART